MRRPPRATRTLLVALLVCLAGCGAVLPGERAPEPGAESPTVTPAPVPGTPTATTTPSLPPGVEADGVDADAIASRTVRAVRGEAYTFQFDEREARPEFSLGTVYVGPRIVGSVEAPDRYVLRVTTVNERGGGLSIETFENATYVTSRTVYRFDGENRSERATVSEDVGRPTRLVRSVVERHLAVENATVRRYGNGTAVVDGTAARAANGTDYSVQAVVGPTGVVRSFEAIYTRDGRVQFATFSLERGTTFEPPAWYEDRLEGGNATATAPG